MARDVFISYSTQDSVVAEAAREALETAGHTCWIAPRDIAPGRDWSAEIIDALEGCRVFLLIFSQHSNDSEQVKREVQNAVSQRLPIVPFRIDNVVLSKQMRYFIGTPHWLTAINPPLEEHIPRLVAAIASLLGTSQSSHQATSSTQSDMAPGESLDADADTSLATYQETGWEPVGELPSGVVTLVFTDIQGSSDLWEAHGDAFAAVLNEHNRLIREAAVRWHGIEVKTEGDAFFLVFPNAANAVRFAVDAQRAIATRDWNAVLPGLAELRVRIGMHTGTPILDRHPGGALDYFGPVVNRAARVGGAGHGGQIVVSNATLELAQGALPSDIAPENLGRHRLKGVGEEILFQINHPELPSRFPLLKTLTGAKHNLPRPATPFIGREGEIANWLQSLREESTRLLTLLGFGGHGKTRLALQLAELMADDFTDGVWWIELEEARDGEAMLSRIAHELRVHLAPQPTIHDQVLDFHRDRHMLLVLDNLEQIPNAGQVVSEILQAGPRVKVLVTTRRALEIRQERVAPVNPLPPSDAAQLFFERAHARSPEFEVTAENSAAVEELCRRLEGVPLAIELAASRITVLSPAEMLERLDEQFRLLQTRAPDLPPRQRALRGAIDWSHDLLSEEDRGLFAALAVFAGGFDLKAVDAVCGDFDVLEGLAELRRHSLLRAEESGGKTRFSMLESVRVYAAEKLEDLPDADSIRKQHAVTFQKRVLAWASKLRTREEAQALEGFFADRANSLAALEWCHEHAAPNSAPFVAALHQLLHRIGFWTEARQVLESGLAAGGSESHKAHLQLLLASLRHDRGESGARDLAESALHKFEELGEPIGQATALNLLGLLSTDAGDATVAQALFEKSLTLGSADDHNRRAVALHNLALLARRRGESAEARKLYEQALEQRRAAGDARGEAETLGNLGALMLGLDEPATAKSLYLQSLELRRTLRDRIGIALMLFNLAEIAEGEKDWPRVVILYTHAGRIFRELGSSFASAAAEALQKLENELKDEYPALRATAAKAAWEEWV